MSRIGKLPINIPKNVEVKIVGKSISVKGSKGELKRNIDNSISIELKDSTLKVIRKNDQNKSKAMHGLYRALISNMVVGVSEGFSKKLELVGVGFKVELKQNYVAIFAGFSHPIYFLMPKGVKADAPSPTSIIISGTDKELVGSVAAKLRSFRKPEPYKGKGICYENEKIRRKEGKTASK